jgi:hypothetical protein
LKSLIKKSTKPKKSQPKRKRKREKLYNRRNSRIRKDLLKKMRKR